MPDFDQRADELMEKEYMLIDILPEQVPAGSKGQFFGIEEYYLQKSRLDAIRRSFADMLLKLNCYADFELSPDPEEAWQHNPPPAFLDRLIRTGGSNLYLRIYLPDEEMLILLRGDDFYMTVYHPSEKMLWLLRALTWAEGLFLRPQPESSQKTP